MDYFTFLGIGNGGYKEICYEYDNDLIPTKYVQQVVLRSFKTQIDRIVVFCTAESKEINGNGLNEVLLKEKPDIEIEYLIIPANISSMDFIEALIDQVKSDEIIVDITHIFRHIPMKMLFMIKYIEKSRNTTISHLFYGKHAGGSDEMGELIDFIDDYNVQELTEALNLFEKTLYLSPEIIERFAAKKQKAEKDQKIEQLLRIMHSLNAHLETCSYDDTLAACRKIIEICSSIKKNADEYPVLLPFTEMIRKKFDGINVNNKYYASIKLIQVLLQNHKLQAAITFADNLFRTSLIEKSTDNYQDILNNPYSRNSIYDYSQELIYGQNGYHCIKTKGNGTKTIDLKRIRLNGSLLDYLSDNDDIRYFYQEIRNSVNHAGQTNKNDAEQSIKKMLQIVEDMEHIVR